MPGIQESKDVLKLVEVVAVAIIKESCKDGFQITDLGAFLKSPAFEAAVGPAMEGIEKVPGELSDLSWLESIQFGRAVYDSVMNIVEEIKTC